MKSARLQTSETGAPDKAHFTRFEPTIAGLIAFAVVCAVLLAGGAL